MWEIYAFGALLKLGVDKIPNVNTRVAPRASYILASP